MTNMKKSVLSAASCYLLIAIFGCTPITISEEQKKHILAVDPDFEKTLELKSEFDNQLAGRRAQFLSEKNIYESKIAALRREFEAKKANFYSQAQQVKSQLEPQREKIRQEIAVVSEELRNKMKSLGATKNMLKQAKSLLEGKFSQGIPEEDKLEWQKRFDSLTEESKKINQEAALFKERLYVLKLKQRSLIQ